MLRELHRIINDAIATAGPGDDQRDAIRLDLSKIDLERLRKEFAKKVKRKASAIQGIRELIEAKLAKMLANNPMRMDYYARYGEIVAEYNREKDRVTIEDTFAKLAEHFDRTRPRFSLLIRQTSGHSCSAVPSIMTFSTRIALLGCLLVTGLPSPGEEEAIPLAVPVEEAEAPRAVPVEEAPEALVFGDAVLSESKQFRVRGGPGALRGSVALLADQTRAEFLHLTGEITAPFKIPVNIVLVGNPGDPAPQRTTSINITIGEQGYELRLNVHTGRGIDVGAIQHAVTAALIYERTLADRPADDDLDAPLAAPPWLIEGLREANRWRLGGGDRRLYDALFASGGLFKLDDLFNTTEAAHEGLDGATRAAFQVSSGALVMALLEQPDGREAFRKFLGDVALFAGEMPSLLRRQFPDLNLSENSMAKWWQLQLANKGAAKLTESLSIAETEAGLQEALRLRFRTTEGDMRDVALDDWLEMADLDDVERVAAVRMAEDSLVRLSYRSFPTYRPLLAAYQDVLNKLAHNTAKPEAIAIQLDDLAATRQTIIAKAARARDYLDWFEITRARETSGAFNDFLRLKSDLATNPRTPRQDPVTTLLDRFDTIFHRETDDRQHGPGGGSAWTSPNLLPRP